MMVCLYVPCDWHASSMKTTSRPKLAEIGLISSATQMSMITIEKMDGWMDGCSCNGRSTEKWVSSFSSQHTSATQFKVSHLSMEPNDRPRSGGVVDFSRDGGMKMRGVGHPGCIHSLLRTSVSKKPRLRKTQAGPATLCSILLFFTSVPKGSLNSFSFTSSSSSSSSSCRCAPLTSRPRDPSDTPFRGRPGC